MLWSESGRERKRGRDIRRSAALGDGIKVKERESKEKGETRRDKEEKTMKFVKQLLGNHDMFGEGFEIFFWLKKYSQVESEP